MHRLPRNFLALAIAAAAQGASAGSASGSFQVNATVASACTVSGAPLNFGSSIDPLLSAVPIDASTTLTVQCTNTTPYSVALDAGLHAGGGSIFGSRAMSNGAQLIGYQLYLDAGRASVWGDGTGGSLPVGGTGTGSSQSLSIYGRLPSLTGAIPASYSDTVTITISY